MTLTNEEIYEIVGDIDTSEELSSYPRRVNMLAQALETIATDFDTEEEFLAYLGDMFAPLREHLGGTDVDDNMSRAFEAADRRNNNNNTDQQNT